MEQSPKKKRNRLRSRDIIVSATKCFRGIDL
jgi:hypothetical protein